MMSQFFNCETEYSYCDIEKCEFGNFQDTYNWIECESVTYPGKIYFFNLRSLCSTWKRPLPEHVQLQRYSKKSKIYNDNFTHDISINYPLMIVSSENEEKRDDYNNGDDEYSELHNSFTENNNFNENKIDKCLHSSDTKLNILESKLCTNTPKHRFINIKEDNKSMIKKNTSIEKEFVLYTFPDERKETEAVQNHSVLNSQNGNPCLKGKKQQKKRTPTNSKKQKISKKTELKTKEIIFNMCGIKTISYDSIEPKLPPGVECRNLSDSSSTTSSLSQAKDAKPVLWNDLKILNINSHLNLSSELSSSSSTSTSTSSSSTSTSTSRSCSCCSSSTSSNARSTSKKE